MDDKVCNKPRVSKRLNFDNVEEHQMKADHDIQQMKDGIHNIPPEFTCLKGDISCLKEDISWTKGVIEGHIFSRSGIPKSPHGRSFGDMHGLEDDNGNASLHQSPIAKVPNQDNVEVKKNIVHVNSNNSSSFHDEQLQNFDMMVDESKPKEVQMRVSIVRTLIDIAFIYLSL